MKSFDSTAYSGRTLRRLLQCAVILILALNLSFASNTEAEEQGPKKEISLETPQGHWIPGMAGFWIKAPLEKESGLSNEQREQIENLESLGYLSGYEKTRKSGLSTHDVKRAFNGFNLVTSGHKPEAVLMDMKGKILHKWHYDYSDIQSPDKIVDEKVINTPGNIRRVNSWRRSHLYPNGDLLAIYESFGLIKVDSESRMKWFFPGRAHHDLFVAKDGKIYVLTRKGRVIPELNKNSVILDDFISILSPDGKELERISLVECFQNSPFASLPLPQYQQGGDIFHTNTIEILGDSFKSPLPAFKPGNALISIRNLHVIGVVDLEKKSLVWMMQGPWMLQHEPQMMPNGDILLFDNIGGEGKYSRILQFNPTSGEIVWQYQGKAPDDLYSRYGGTVHLLPNGNMVVAETCSGKAFELSYKDKEILWEFYNPYRAGENGEYIAALFDIVRLPPDFPVSYAFNNNPTSHQ